MTDEQITKAFWATCIVCAFLAVSTFVLIWTNNHHEFRMTCLKNGGDVIRKSMCKLSANQKDRK